jgi:hypothetical protein
VESAFSIATGTRASPDEEAGEAPTSPARQTGGVVDDLVSPVRVRCRYLSRGHHYSEISLGRGRSEAQPFARVVVDLTLPLDRRIIMIKATPRIVTLLALATATTAMAGVSAAAAAPATSSPAATTTAGIKGWARMDWPEPGNDIQVTVDAHGTFASNSPYFPTQSGGTFRIYHRIDQPNGNPPVVNWGDFKVDCLTTGGPTVTVTGILVRTTPGGYWQDFLDRHGRMGVSFYVAGKDGGPSRIGLSGATLPGEPLLTKCMAPAANEAVIQGGYTLKGKGPLH